MSAFRTDGTFTSAQAIGAARKSFPFDGDNSSFIVEQDFMVLLTSFTPLTLSTAHPTYTNAYLVKESQLEDLGAGLVKWTRTYAQIPANLDTFETFNYRFIGFLGAGTPPYNQYTVQVGDQRDPFTKTVVARVTAEYFLCETGQTYTTPTAIPVNEAQKYTFDGLPNNPVDYLVDAATNPSATDTDPTLPDYRLLVSGEDEVIAEDSTLERWMGNIYVRKTRRVKAL